MGAAVLALAAGLAPATAYHGTGLCSTAGLPKVTAPVSADQVPEGKIDRFSVKVPAGTQGFLHVQPLNGDADIQVCKSGKRGSAHVCSSHNTANVGDGCHLQEASVPDVADVFTGEYLFEWGAPLTPGTYRVDVLHCFSSTSPGSCDYSPNNDGALDGLGPIHYLVLFTTN